MRHIAKYLDVDLAVRKLPSQDPGAAGTLHQEAGASWFTGIKKGRVSPAFL